MERDDTSKPGKNASGKAAIGKKRTAKPRPYPRPRGGPAKQVSDLVPQIGRAAFRRRRLVGVGVVLVVELELSLALVSLWSVSAEFRNDA